MDSAKLKNLQEKLEIVQKEIDIGLDYGGPAPPSIYEEERRILKEIQILEESLKS